MCAPTDCDIDPGSNTLKCTMKNVPAGTVYQIVVRAKGTTAKSTPYTNEVTLKVGTDSKTASDTIVISVSMGDESCKLGFLVYI